MDDGFPSTPQSWTGADWRQALVDLNAAGVPHVLVTLVTADGSTPRAAGTKMVVAATGQADTIGGGAMEKRAIETARRLLEEGAMSPLLDKQTLGIDQDQCCGGATTLLYEPMAVPALRLALFGAGHVGRALVRVLEGADVHITWIDERPDLPREGRLAPRIVADPPAEVARLPAGTHVRIMTHSHKRDFEIIDAALARDDLGSIGLIGSKTKWGHFRSRLRKMGVPERCLEAVICPIGLPGVGGKRPAEIAVSVAAQLLSRPRDPKGPSDAE